MKLVTNSIRFPNDFSLKIINQTSSHHIPKIWNRTNFEGCHTFTLSLQIGLIIHNDNSHLRFCHDMEILPFSALNNQFQIKNVLKNTMARILEKQKYQHVIANIFNEFTMINLTV